MTPAFEKISSMITRPEEKNFSADQGELCSCGSARFWIDRFGGQHCIACKPPASRSMVARVVDGPSVTWTTNSKSPMAPSLDESALDREFDRHWMSYVLPDGRTVHERRDYATAENRLAIASLERQERNLR